MRVLGAASLGGPGHLLPLVPFLAAARRRGDTTAGRGWAVTTAAPPTSRCLGPSASSGLGAIGLS
ncbi:MAG TPA: hypothetical protein VMD59_20630 [Acidimicrobiales bacterium]|nr:hypothetical protein [Acidimicrobiales bacterium]